MQKQQLAKHAIFPRLRRTCFFGNLNEVNCLTCCSGVEGHANLARSGSPNICTWHPHGNSSCSSLQAAGKPSGRRHSLRLYQLVLPHQDLVMVHALDHGPGFAARPHRSARLCEHFPIGHTQTALAATSSHLEGACKWRLHHACFLEHLSLRQACCFDAFTANIRSVRQAGQCCL